MNEHQPHRRAFPPSFGRIHDRDEFAARVRAARAVLGWTQAELGAKAGITQRSINRVEHGDVDVRHSTALAIERVFRDAGISFSSSVDGQFEMRVVGTWANGRERG
jgi:DNA-binding XRE family transcriptional regulator